MQLFSRLRSRSLTELTRQITPPTKNGQYNQLDHESDPELTPDCERNLGEDLSLVAE